MTGPKNPLSVIFLAIGLTALWVPVAGMALAQDASELQRRLDEAQKQNDVLREQLAKMEAELKAVMAMTAKVQAELQAIQAERDKNLQSVVELTDQLHQAFSEVKRLKELNAQLRALVPQPPGEAAGLAGLVLATPGAGPIQISLGADDGLKQGQRLAVYRVSGDQRTELGQVEVVTLAPNSAVCKNDPKLLKGPLKKGDRVTTQLNAAAPPPPGVSPPNSDAPPELIDGRVLSVGENEEVEISFGADDGLRPGHRLEVYRVTDGQGIYIGRVEVVRTTAKKSVCKSILEFRKDAIRQGDRVVSKIH